MYVCVVKVCLLLALVNVSLEDEIETHYMANFCGERFSMRSRDLGEMLLELTGNDIYDIFMDCEMEITTEPDELLEFTFLSMDLIGCADHLTIFDYNFDSPNPITPQLCNKPSDRYRTDTNSAYLVFQSDWFANYGGFKILVTSYRPKGMMPCETSYFECDTPRCIKSELTCNSRNNCGDDSDEHDDCDNNQWWIIVVGVLAGLAVLSALIAVAWWMCNQNKMNHTGKVLVAPQPMNNSSTGGNPQQQIFISPQSNALPPINQQNWAQPGLSGPTGSTPIPIYTNTAPPSTSDMYDNAVPSPAVYINPTATKY